MQFDFERRTHQLELNFFSNKRNNEPTASFDNCQISSTSLLHSVNNHLTIKYFASFGKKRH